jgi:hypothetical protein
VGVKERAQPTQTSLDKFEERVKDVEEKEKSWSEKNKEEGWGEIFRRMRW